MQLEVELVAFALECLDETRDILLHGHVSPLYVRQESEILSSDHIAHPDLSS